MNKAAKEVKTALLMLFGRDTNAWKVAGLTAVHGNITPPDNTHTRTRTYHVNTVPLLTHPIDRKKIWSYSTLD